MEGKMSNTGRVVACNSSGKKSNRLGFSGKWLAAAAGAAWVQLMPSPHGWQVARADLVTWSYVATNTGTWDTTSTNWYDVSDTTPGATYAEGDAVQFPGTDTGAPSSTANVVIANVTGSTPNGVSPASVEFTSGSENYTFSAVSGNTLGIQGNASVTLDASYTGTAFFNETNTYTGPTTINGGSLEINGSGTAPYGVGNSPITLGGGSLALHQSGSLNVNNTITVTAGTTTSSLAAGSTGYNWTFGGSLSSSATATPTNTVLNITGGNTDTFANMSGFTGTIEMGADGGGTVRLNDGASSAPAGGSSNAIFDLGSSTVSFISYNGGGSGTGAFPNAIPLGALEGTGTGSKVEGAHNSGSTVFAIGGLGLSTTYNGTILNGSAGPLSLYIVGGALTLTGDNTYTNVSGQAGTTIANGAVYANNATSSTGTGGVLVEGKSGVGLGYGILGGDGTVLDGTTVNSTSAGVAAFAQGGLIAPGASGVSGPIGTLTLTGGLTLNDWTNLAYTLNDTNASGNDLISTSNGNLTLSGNSLTQVAFTFDNGGPELGVPYDLINYGTGTLGYVAGGSNASVSGWTATGVPAGDTATFSTPANGQVDVTFTEVPEPATIGMLGIASLGLLRRRRARA
jgi:fibronectin-binding autotransporter adhesin